MKKMSKQNNMFHLYIWNPEKEDKDGNSHGGEMEHFSFLHKEELIQYLNQFAMELEHAPTFTNEFGLVKASKMTINDYVQEGFIFINYGADMNVTMGVSGKSSFVEDIYFAD